MKEQIEELVMGIAHRGRLNLMVLLLDLHPSLLFTKVKFYLDNIFRLVKSAIIIS